MQWRQNVANTSPQLLYCSVQQPSRRAKELRATVRDRSSWWSATAQDEFRWQQEWTARRWQPATDQVRGQVTCNVNRFTDNYLHHLHTVILGGAVSLAHGCGRLPGQLIQSGLKMTRQVSNTRRYVGRPSPSTHRGNLPCDSIQLSMDYVH